MLSFIHSSPSTTIQTADLIAEKYLPARAKCRLFGNAPAAVHVYKYRDAKSGQRFGVQVSPNACDFVLCCMLSGLLSLKYIAHFSLVISEGLPTGAHYR